MMSEAADKQVPEEEETDGPGPTPETTAVVVHSCKYDGRVARTWGARLARGEGPLLVLDAVFDELIEHPLLGTIRPGTLSTEYYWTDRWYSVFRFAEPSGALRNFYCNINTPARFDGRVLSYVDLDIDVLVAPDLSFRVLDEDEFALHAEQYGYPEDLRAAARQSLAELISLIEGRRFPFQDKSPES